MTEDWLDIEPTGTDLVIEALNSDASAERIPVVSDKVDPEYRNLVLMLRKMKPIKRRYLRALIQTGGRRMPAIRALHDRMFALDVSTVSKWHKDLEFCRAVETIRNLVLKTAEIDPVSLMLRAREVIDSAMEPSPVIGRDGAIVGYEVDRGAAMRGIEWLGKVHRMTEEENKTRVTLEVVNIGMREDREPIEGEFTEVTK